jgi:hypothetical protein
MGPAQIRAAVDDFLDGPWANTASVFTICTTTNLRSKARSEEVARQRSRLEKAGKYLETLDVERLSVLLKDEPVLVDDFFERAWVEAFNGTPAAEGLVGHLDRRERTATRRDLAGFYQEVFRVNDGGLALAPLGAEPPDDLRELFVPPDLIGNIDVHSTSKPTDGPASSKVRGDDGHDDFPAASQNAGGPRAQVRIAAETWLRPQRRIIVSGNAGTGKSSLLRFLALDLLSEDPQFGDLAWAWQAPIPLWIPFGRWTELIEEGGERSLTSLLRRWLDDFDRHDLMGLYEKALDDGRAVLLIDGLDEWTTKSSARLAFNLLRVFAAERDLRAIATTRPSALQETGLTASDWALVRIADLLRDQQLAVVERLTRWACPKAGGGLVPERFIEELSMARDLRDLASVPLTLVFLYWIRASDARLPRDRFQAYEDLLNLLLSEHPARRSAAASMRDSGPPLDEDDFQFALADLAYAVQRDGGRDIPLDAAVKILGSYLGNEDLGPGLAQAQAREVSLEIIKDARDRVGLLIETGSKRFAFLHRSVQEHLSAVHLSRLPIDQQLDFLSVHGPESRWKEVALSLLHLTTRPDEVDRLVEKLRIARQKAGWIEGDPLMAEIGAGRFGCRSKLAKELVDQAAGQCETFARPSLGAAIAERLAERLDSRTDGLNLTSRVVSWLPPRPWTREGLFEGMADWPDDSETNRTLIRASFSDNARDARGAAQSYMKRRLKVGEGPGFLQDALKHAIAPTPRAAVLEALANGWPAEPATKRELGLALKSESPILRLVATHAAVNAGTATNQMLEDLISMGRDDSGLDLEWQDKLLETLARGWQRSPRLKKICLEELRGGRSQRVLRHGFAEELLLRNFPGDPDVVAYCIRQIQDEEYPFIFDNHSAWRVIAGNFSGIPELVVAVDRWIEKEEHHEPEVSFAAGIGWTDIAKKRLIQDVQDSWIPFWAGRALLDGWGMSDSEVRAVLEQVALGQNEAAAKIAHLLPEILGKRGRSGERLIELMEDDSISRIDLVLQGVQVLDDPDLAKEAASRALRFVGQRSRGFDVLDQLIDLDPTNLRIKDAALASLKERNPPLFALGRRYGEDSEIKKALLAFAAPLSAAAKARCWEQVNAIGVNADLASVAESYPGEGDPIVATTMARAHARAANDPTLRENALRVAIGELRTGDPDWETHAQAGVMALLELGRLDAFVPICFVGGKREKPFSVPLSDYRKSNVELAASLVDHWEQVVETLGPDFPDRFRGISGGPDESFWDVIAAVADRAPESQAAMSAQVRDSSKAMTASRLEFLARTQPRSNTLSAACLRAISGAVGYDPSAIIAASETLAEQFGETDELGDRILEEFREDPTPARLVAISEGWPGERADAAIAIARDLKLAAPVEYVWRTHIAAGPTDLAIEGVKAFLNAGWGYLRWLDRPPLRSLLRRLARDGDFAGDLTSQLAQESATPSEHASFSRLLAMSGGLDPAMRLTLRARLEKPIGREIGVDLVAEAPRPVAHSLADALELT